MTSILSSCNYHIQVSNYIYIDLSCPPGTFQPQLQGDCLPCPLNTNRSVVNATMCHCLQGYFRSIFEGPEFPCTRESASIILLLY